MGQNVRAVPPENLYVPMTASEKNSRLAVTHFA
jgi:hypothetical protein